MARRARAGLLVATVAAAACAPYSARTVDLLPELAAGDFEGALATLEDSRRPRDELLYLLQKGLVLHQAERFTESNAVFESAERLADELYTRSISEAAASLFVNDSTISYRAEPFELALVPYYRSLNYIHLGEPGEALVEARKASHELERYVDLTGRAFAGDESWASARERLNNNAFLQYYSGLLYEWNGEINDAFIAYRNAAGAYALAAEALDLGLPASLGEDLRRTAERLGFAAELERLRGQYPALFADAGASAVPGGEVVVLLELGNVPPKVQREIDFPILETDDYDDYDAWAVDLERRAAAGWHAPQDVDIDYWLRVAFPQLASARPAVRGASVFADPAGEHATAALVEDVEGRALATFDAKRPKILLKTIARALVKYAAKKEAEEESEVAGYIVNLLGAVVEQADTRSWTALPNSIAMARLTLPPGTYELHVELLAADGRPLGTEHLPGVVVRQDDWTFVALRVY